MSTGWESDLEKELERELMGMGIHAQRNDIAVPIDYGAGQRKEDDEEIHRTLNRPESSNGIAEMQRTLSRVESTNSIADSMTSSASHKSRNRNSVSGSSRRGMGHQGRSKIFWAGTFILCGVFILNFLHTAWTSDGEEVRYSNEFVSHQRRCGHLPCASNFKEKDYQCDAHVGGKYGLVESSSQSFASTAVLVSVNQLKAPVLAEIAKLVTLISKSKRHLDLWIIADTTKEKNVVQELLKDIGGAKQKIRVGVDIRVFEATPNDAAMAFPALASGVSLLSRKPSWGQGKVIAQPNDLAHLLLWVSHPKVMKLGYKDVWYAPMETAITDAHIIFNAAEAPRNLTISVLEVPTLPKGTVSPCDITTYGGTLGWIPVITLMDMVHCTAKGELKAATHLCDPPVQF